MTYTNQMVTTNQKPVNIQRIKGKESNYITKERQQSMKESKRRKDQRKSVETTTKQVKNDNKYVSINNYFECKWSKCSKQKLKEFVTIKPGLKKY